MKEQVFVSGSNYFNKDSLNKMISLLNEGKVINVGIDCIGHTRNNMEQEAYKKALEEYYGNKLITIYNSGICSYSYSYKLGDENNE